MSWHFSLVLVEAFSEACFLGGEQSVLWKSIPIAPDDSCSAKMKGTCHRSPFGTMFVPSMAAHGEGLLMSFLADSHARTSVPRVDLGERESPAKKADCGGNTLGSFAKWSPIGRLWKTAQCLLGGGLMLYSGIWPRFGMMRNGECFPLPTLEHNTSVRGYGSSQIIGTPIASARSRSEVFMRNSPPNPYEFCKKQNGRPRIEWIENLMGWPLGWSGTEPLETGKFRQWLHTHGIG